MVRDELVDTLLSIDEEAFLTIGDLSVKPVVVIVGGAAFMLRDLTDRQVTHDIDVLMADDAVREVMALYPNVNGSVSSFADQIPYNFEDRLVRLDIGSRAIDFVTPSTEDLIVMKLYARRPNDMQDVLAAINRNEVNWSLLERLVYGPGKADASALSSRRYAEMTGAYEELKARCSRCH